MQQVEDRRRLRRGARGERKAPEYQLTAVSAAVAAMVGQETALATRVVVVGAQVGLLEMVVMAAIVGQRRHAEAEAEERVVWQAAP